MQTTRPKSGLSTLKTIIIVAVVAIVGYFGYALYTSYKAMTDETVSTQVDDVKPAPAISTPADLDQAAATVEEAEIEDSNMNDMTEIENELSAF